MAEFEQLQIKTLFSTFFYNGTAHEIYNIKHHLNGYIFVDFSRVRMHAYMDLSHIRIYTQSNQNKIQ